MIQLGSGPGFDSLQVHLFAVTTFFLLFLASFCFLGDEFRAWGSLEKTLKELVR
jgi:hypothetical protein